jgi:hypothetical protein
VVFISQKPLERIFAAKFNDAEQYFIKNNKCGNLNGLFSHYIVGTQVNLLWNTEVNDEWVNEHPEILQGNFLVLSIVGYSLSQQTKKSKSMISAFERGFLRLKQREPFPNDKIAFPFYPREFLGIVLGIMCLSEEQKKDNREWLLEILTNRMQLQFNDAAQKKLYQIIEALLDQNKAQIGISDIKNSSIHECYVIYWAFKKQLFLLNDLSILSKIRETSLEHFFDNITQDDLFVPLEYITLKNCLVESIDQSIISSNQVVRLLNNFESAMRRWPNKKEHVWPIINEKDIQSILWLILRSVFDDVSDEEPFSRIGHKYSIVDFRIPSLQLLVEAKYIWKREDFGEIEDQIKIDSFNYLREIGYKEMIVFIYDESASVQEHQLTISALENLGVKKVIIASRPSQLAPKKRSKKRKKRLDKKK